VNNNNTEQIGKFLFTSLPNEKGGWLAGWLARWLAGKGFKKKEERKKKDFFLSEVDINNNNHHQNKIIK